MWILLISLIALAVLAFALGYVRNKLLEKKIEKGEIERIPETIQTNSECCGQHAICERDSLLAAASKKIEYYDDEELDNYKGIAASEYTEEQIEDFREIFYTMQEVDVAGWYRSLQLREINLPDVLKDEVLLVIGERRFH